MTRPYQKENLVLERGHPNAAQVRALQRDLRALGYLKNGIDGAFGDGTRVAVMALQYDLLHNDGRSTAGDGPAPVGVLNYNRGRVFDVSGKVDFGLASCIDDMLDDAELAKLPFAADPKSENRALLRALQDLRSDRVPVPFLLGALKQESALKHFNEPGSGDEDTYITVGLDRNATKKFIITSRGYGAGQYTLFHHPPRLDEVEDFMVDVTKNVSKAIGELREKFERFVIGNTEGTRASDRIAEVGAGPLRACKYSPADARFMRDCRACLQAAGTQTITMGETEIFAGSPTVYATTQYYKTQEYKGVPVREKIPCDWPYAVRRYNGAGLNSYHYQARVLTYTMSGI